MIRLFLPCGALIAAIFLAGLTHPAAGQVVLSDFKLEITPPGDTPVAPGMFGLQATTAGSIVFAYDVSTGLVSLDSADESIPLASADADQIFSDRFEVRLASQDRSGLYNPLTCFDLNAPPTGSGLQIRAADVNGHTVIDDFYLYQGAPPEIAPDQIVYSFDGTERSINVPAPPGSACFYRLMNGQYSFFGGSLSPASGLSVEYVGPTTVPLGDTLTYEWRITNSSGQSVEVHYQELFPANPDFFEGLSFASSEPQQRGQVTVAATGSEGIQPTAPRTLEANAQVGDYLDLYFAAAGLDGTAVMAASKPQRISVVPARVPTQIEKNAGDEQSATVGTAVAIPPGVIVRDENNEPVQGVEVTFAVTSDGGSVNPATVQTDENGVATVSGWNLGVKSGTNTLVASVADIGSVTFTAQGQPGPADQLAISIVLNDNSTLNQENSTVANRGSLPFGQPATLNVEIQDVYGNRLPNSVDSPLPSLFLARQALVGDGIVTFTVGDLDLPLVGITVAFDSNQGLFSREISGTTAGDLTIFASVNVGNTIEATLPIEVTALPPTAPTIGTATAGDAQAEVAFTPGADNGSAITGYKVTSDPTTGGVTDFACAGSPCTITGLTNSTAFTFTVVATNAIGDSLPSAASNSVTPAAP